MGELPPKLDGTAREPSEHHSDSDYNDAPTVVIDSSMEEVQNYRGDLDEYEEGKTNE